MRTKGFACIIAFLLVIVLAVGCSQTETTTQEQTTEPETQQQTDTPTGTVGMTGTKVVAVPQLDSGDRESSATMGLLNAPPMQPADHVNYWNPEQRQESCLVCHNHPEVAKYPTPAHYYDEQQGGKIFRDNCVQCHPTQNDTKAAFNE